MSEIYLSQNAVVKVRLSKDVKLGPTKVPTRDRASYVLKAGHVYNVVYEDCLKTKRRHYFYPPSGGTIDAAKLPIFGFQVPADAISDEVADKKPAKTKRKKAKR